METFPYVMQQLGSWSLENSIYLLEHIQGASLLNSSQCTGKSSEFIKLATQ